MSDKVWVLENENVQITVKKSPLLKKKMIIVFFKSSGSAFLKSSNLLRTYSQKQ